MIVRCRGRMINVTPKGSEGRSWRTCPPTVMANKASLDMGLLKIHTKAEEDGHLISLLHAHTLTNTHPPPALFFLQLAHEQTFTHSGISVDIPPDMRIPRHTLAYRHIVFWHFPTNCALKDLMQSPHLYSIWALHLFSMPSVSQLIIHQQMCSCLLKNEHVSTAGVWSSASFCSRMLWDEESF